MAGRAGDGAGGAGAGEGGGCVVVGGGVGVWFCVEGEEGAGAVEDEGVDGVGAGMRVPGRGCQSLSSWARKSRKVAKGGSFGLGRL